MANKKLKKTTGPLGIAGTKADGSSKSWAVEKVWTKKLGKKFTPVSKYFLENYHRLPFPISATEFLFIVHLLKFKWDEAMPFPAIGTLAKNMLKSSTAVRAAARSLERKKYLKRHMTRGRPNHFDLEPLFKAVEKLYDADNAAEAKSNEAGKRRRNRRTG